VTREREELQKLLNLKEIVNIAGKIGGSKHDENRTHTAKGPHEKVH